MGYDFTDHEIRNMVIRQDEGCIVDYAWGLPELPGVAMTWPALGSRPTTCVSKARPTEELLEEHARGL